MESPKGKTAAIISYMTIIGSLIAISMNTEPKHEFARFHTRQAFGIHLMFHGLAIFFSTIQWNYAIVFFYLFFFAVWLNALILALRNKKIELPWLGSYFQKWFTFIP